MIYLIIGQLILAGCTFALWQRYIAMANQLDSLERDATMLAMIVDHNAEATEDIDRRGRDTKKAARLIGDVIADHEDRMRRVELRSGLNPLAPVTPIHIDTPESWTLGG